MAEQDKTRSMPRNMGQHATTIRQLRIKSGLTPMQLADKIGVTKGAVYKWENGKGRPDFSILPLLCDALNVSADEVIGRKSVELNSNEHELLEKYRRLSHYDQISIIGFIDTLRQNRLKERQDYCIKSFMPIFIAPYAMGAGLGEPLGDNCEQEQIYVRITKESSRADKVIRVNGDSMMPTFQDGDLLFVQETENLKAGEIGVFVLAGEGYVKEYQRDGLQSHNANYSTIIPNADDDVRCLGRIIGKVETEMLPNEEELRILEDVFA